MLSGLILILMFVKPPRCWSECIKSHFEQQPTLVFNPMTNGMEIGAELADVCDERVRLCRPDGGAGP